MTLTTEEIVREWGHIYQTRISFLCGACDPTNEQKRIASEDADAHICALKLQQDKEP